MLNIYLALLTGFVLGLLAWFPVFRRYCKVKVREILDLKKQHEEQFAQLIERMNHEGPVPKAATAKGLLNLILWALSKAIDDLLRLREKRDWDTSAVITELREIGLVELRLLHKQLGEFLESRHEILKDHDKHQGL